MEDKTKVLSQQDPSLDSHKPQILAKFAEYIKNDIPEKTRKKHSKFMEELLNARTEQLSFGESPRYKTGYVYGNVTAEGSRDVGNTTYSHTLSMNLQTPERVFFNISKNDSNRAVFKRACLRFAPKRYVYTVKKQLNSLKQISKVYVDFYEDEALQDYAMDICEEQLARLNFSIHECRVNDYDLIETQEAKDSNIYPVYLTLKNQKGEEYKILVGYYSAEKDSAYFEIDSFIEGPPVLAIIIGAIILAPAVLGILFGLVRLISGMIR